MELIMGDANKSAKSDFAFCWAFHRNAEVISMP